MKAEVLWGDIIARTAKYAQEHTKVLDDIVSARQLLKKIDMISDQQIVDFFASTFAENKFGEKWNRMQIDIFNTNTSIDIKRKIIGDFINEEVLPLNKQELLKLKKDYEASIKGMMSEYKSLAQEGEKVMKRIINKAVQRCLEQKVVDELNAGPKQSETNSYDKNLTDVEKTNYYIEQRVKKGATKLTALEELLASDPNNTYANILKTGEIKSQEREAYIKQRAAQGISRQDACGEFDENQKELKKQARLSEMSAKRQKFLGYLDLANEEGYDSMTQMQKDSLAILEDMLLDNRDSPRKEKYGYLFKDKYAFFNSSQNDMRYSLDRASSNVVEEINKSKEYKNVEKALGAELMSKLDVVYANQSISLIAKTGIELNEDEQDKIQKVNLEPLNKKFNSLIQKQLRDHTSDRNKANLADSITAMAIFCNLATFFAAETTVLAVAVPAVIVTFAALCCAIYYGYGTGENVQDAIVDETLRFSKWMNLTKEKEQNDTYKAHRYADTNSLEGLVQTNQRSEVEREVLGKILVPFNR